MARAEPKPQTKPQKSPRLIEFKGTTLPVVSVTLHSLQTEPLTQAASELFGDETFFDGDAAVLELDRIDAAETAEALEWLALRALFKRHGLNVIGVRAGSEALRASASSAGLPSFAAFKRPARSTEDSSPPAPAPTEVKVEATAETRPEAKAEVKVEAPPEAAPPPVPAPAIPTVVLDHPLRSGQQMYARGSDLVVLAAVNAGAEVIADGSIHIYAPLRGRALAGASGSTTARIFTTRFEAELVSIAGVYRTFDAGIPDKLFGRPAKIQLSVSAEDGASRLNIDPLSTD